jgi:hypothetical protein
MRRDLRLAISCGTSIVCVVFLSLVNENGSMASQQRDYDVSRSFMGLLLDAAPSTW